MCVNGSVELIAGKSDTGKRLDAFLHQRLPKYSRSRLQSWIKSGHVLVNGEPVKVSHLLRESEIVAVTPAELTPLKARAEDLPLSILYEDRDVVVVDKPAGMVVHAGAGHEDGTLVNALLHHFGQLSGINGDLRPGIVHRLDRDTSGIIVIARTDVAHQYLARQFHDREVEKIYLALTQGVPGAPEGRIDAPITRDPVRRTRMTARLNSGRKALTRYRVIETFAKDAALLRVQIETGRTHQIRVHLASIGHPVTGDRIYGAAAVSSLNRSFLHAHRLSFTSPESGQRITLESPLPEELQRYLAHMREKTDRIGAFR